MIYYQRSEWYGLNYLFTMKGSLLPRCMPSMVISGLISGLTAAGYMDNVFQVPSTQHGTRSRPLACQARLTDDR